MDNNPETRRRWYQFSLRTMLIFLGLMSVGFAGWVNHSRDWIKQRHDMLASDAVAVCGSPKYPAPFRLRLFGEVGIPSIVLTDESQAARVEQLFPEAKVVRLRR